MAEDKATKSLPDEIATLIDQWHFESFAGSRVAHETEVWNVVHTAKEELKRRLAALLADHRD